MNKVKELCARKDISQKELAALVGVSQPTVSEWFTNKKNPRGERLEKLSRVFGVSKAEIMGYEPLTTNSDIVDFNTKIWRSKMPVTDQDQPIPLPSTADGIKAARYKECREKKGLSQQFVADSLGVPAAAVAAWEDGTASPDMEQLGALASLYSTDLRYFLGLPGKWEFVELPGKPETNDIRHMIVDELDRQLLEQFRFLSDEKKRAVLALLQTDHPADQKKGEV